MDPDCRDSFSHEPFRTGPVRQGSGWYVVGELADRSYETPWGRSCSILQHRCAEGRAAQLQQLLERKTHRQQISIAEVTTEQLHSNRNTIIGKARGHSECRQTRVSAQLAIRSGLRITDSRSLPAKRWIHHGGQSVLVENGQDSLMDRAAFYHRAAIILVISLFRGIPQAETCFERRVIQAAFQNLTQGLYGRILVTAEIVGQIELELRIDQAAIAQQIVKPGYDYVQYRCPGLLHCVECLIDDAGNFLVFRRRSEKRSYDSNAL